MSAVFADERIGFPATFLHAGQNTINLNMRKGGSPNNHAMYDYLRLELTGYLPPPPASVAAYAGNNGNLISWPVTPGATSYNVFRTTTSGSGYASITNGVTGPVCGSGFNNTTFLDTTAANGTAYYYVVQSVNPGGASTNSPESSGATPDAGISAGAPAAPTGLAVGGVAHHSVTLNWSASAGANFYSIYRSALVDTLGGASNTLSTIVLNNTNTGTSYTDTSPTDGSIYRYFVTATSAGGTSANSSPIVGIALPAPPAGAPATLTGSFVQTTNILLNWSAVSGAIGYIIRQATSTNGPFTYVDNVTKLNYTDVGNTPGTYYYTVTAVNAAGVSTNALVKVVAPPAAPASLTAVAGDSQMILTWSAVANATGYVLKSGTSSGNETTLVLAGYTGTSYTNTGLANGTTYFYVCAATNTGGLGPNSPEASATPSSSIVITARNLTWNGDGAANVWNVSGAANWLSNTTATTFNNDDAVTFDNTGSNNVAVALAGALQPALLTFNASKNYTFSGSGSIAGSNILVKLGTGTLTITATNTYSGGTILSNGIIALSGPAAGGVTANNFALGSGAVDFEGGTLQLYGYNLADNVSTYGSFTNTVVVYGGQTGAFYGGPRYTFGSKVTGSGTLNFNVDYVRGDIGGDWSGYAGTLNIRSTTGTPNAGTTDDFRVASATGFVTTRLAIATNVFMYSRTTAGATIPIGEFSAAVGSFVSAGGGSSAGVQNAVTWRVGGLNSDATNAAIFQGTTALIKEGNGNWTLTGASTQTGATTVNGGTLTLNGSFNGSPLTINGGTLSGNGVIAGAAVTINSAGTLAPGSPFGTLTISNNLTLGDGSTTLMQVQHSPPTNDTLKVTGTFAATGTLNIADTGSGTLTNGDTFVLFNTPTVSGNFTSVILPPLTGSLLWNTNLLKTSGTLSVAALTSPMISGIQTAGTNFVLSGTGGAGRWPFYVLAAGNLTLPLAQWTRIATNQFDSSGNFILTNAISAGAAQQFYLLQLQ